MKTHELKLDVKYFDDVKSGKMNFNVRKNDRDYQVGDILELKAFEDGYYAWKAYPDGNLIRNKVWFSGCPAEKADIITARVTMVIKPEEFNEEGRNGGYWRNIRHNSVVKVLKEFFHADRLPDEYVVLGIEVEE